MIGLQFHLEETRETVKLLMENAADDLETTQPQPWVATAEDLLTPDAPYAVCRGLLFTLLDGMAARAS